MTADFRLGACIVRPQRRIIERGGESIHVKPKAMAVFECLLAAGGEPVSRTELFDKVWPGGEVTDDTLTKCIVELRRAFGDSARESRVIETIPKLGFRLVPAPEPLAGVRAGTEEPPPDSSRHRRLQTVRLLAVALVLVIGAVLLYPRTRLWLTEVGINLFLETAAAVVPYSLGKKPGIAVLPFLNISGDVENEYFSDGMSAEVLNALGRSNRLPVIARSSSFQFKGKDMDVREIGRLLGVTHVLEGSVRRAGDSFRMTVQLIETSTGANLWSGIYQGETMDVFKVQNEIAAKIANQVSVVLGQQILPAISDKPATGFMEAHPPANLEAYDLYLNGLEALMGNRPMLIEQAADYFDGAIALESDYADAWAAKGYALALLGSNGYGSSRIPATVFPAAIAAFRRALEIEPGHAFATGWLGVVLMSNDFKWEEGMRLLKESLTLSPNNANLLAAYGFYLDLMQMEGAGEVAERAYRLDPLGFEPIVDMAIHLARKGRVLEAASLVETSLIQDRDGYAPNYFSAAFNFQIGRLDAAEEYLRKARTVANPIDLNLDVLGWMIDNRRGGPLLPLAEIRERMQTEHLYSVVLWDGYRDEDAIEEYGIDAQDIVDVFELAIEQRHPALRTALFGQKPLLMPEEDWQRIRDTTGVTQFLSSR